MSIASRSALLQLFKYKNISFLKTYTKRNSKVNSRQKLKTFLTQIANNEITCNVNSQVYKKYVSKILELFCVYFIKLNIYENVIGKILHPSKQSLSQIEHNEIKL